MNLNHRSKHVDQDGKVRIVKRAFSPEQIAAGYHTQEFGVASSADHPLLGVHETAFATEERIPFFVAGVEEPQETVKRDPTTITVRHMEEGPTGGPEFELEWSDGMKVTVLDENTVLAYLEDQGVTDHVRPPA